MVEAFNDSKTKLSAVFSGFGIQLTAQLAAPLKLIIDWTVEAVKKMGGLDVAAKLFATSFINGIVSIIRAGKEIFLFVNKLELRIKKLKLVS
jgi:hypothetical protein